MIIIKFPNFELDIANSNCDIYGLDVKKSLRNRSKMDRILDVYDKNCFFTLSGYVPT